MLGGNGNIRFGAVVFDKETGRLHCIGETNGQGHVLENLGREPPSLSQKTEDGSRMGLPAQQRPKAYHQNSKGLAKEEAYGVA